jgi:hypothetical protein
LCWHCHPLCVGIIALVVLALLPLSCKCCCPCSAGVIDVCGVVYHIVRSLVHASSTRAKMPANQLHDTNTIRAKRVTATVTETATATAMAMEIATATLMAT